MAEEKQTPEVQFPSQPEMTVPAVRDKRILPEGVVPKQAQGYVVAGLAVLILLAVMFSKNHSKPTSKETASSPTVASTDANQRKIQELEQDLSADQRQSQQQATAQRAGTASAPAGTATGNNPTQSGVAAPAAQLPPPVVAQSTEPPRDPVADAEKALAFKARFASNLVTAEDNAPRPLADSSGAGGTPIRSPSLPQAAAAQPAAASTSGNKRAPEVNVNSAHGQPFVVFEGTTIDTVLVNRLDGEFAGPLKVMVTNPIYNQDRQHLLIPEGTFILGDVQKVAGLGQKRLAVTFHRLLMPDGYSVDLDQFHGLDQAGSTGLKDKVNNHYVEISARRLRSASLRALPKPRISIRVTTNRVRRHTSPASLPVFRNRAPTCSTASSTSRRRSRSARATASRSTSRRIQAGSAQDQSLIFIASATDTNMIATSSTGEPHEQTETGTRRQPDTAREAAILYRPDGCR
jgi:type IV secretion system protein VirB10